MTKSADIIVYSEDGEIQLVVEVKKNRNVTYDWVSQLRRNLLAHSIVPVSQYFLIVMPDYCYLWRDNMRLEKIKANYKIPTKNVLNFHTDDFELRQVSEQGLELLTRAWLSNLINSQLTIDTSRSELNWLFESGLYDSIKRGSIRSALVA